MEKTDLENQNLRKPNGGKPDTNLSALADSMQFLSLGVPGVSRPKKFNVNAWSTPLKSIENQQRRATREKVGEIESAVAVGNDDSLSNLSDLFPGQNVFEKTSDLIEYYRVNSAAASNCTPIDDRADSFEPARPSRSPNESTVADLGVSTSYSPDSPTAFSSSPGYGESPPRNGCDLFELPTDDEDDVSSCDSTTSDDHFYLAVSHVADASAHNQVLGSVTEHSVEGLRESGATSDGTDGRVEKGVEPVSECDDGSPLSLSKEVGRQNFATDAGVPGADDEHETVIGSPWSSSPAKLTAEPATNRSPAAPSASRASQHFSGISHRATVEERSRTPLSQCCDDGRSFVDHFQHLAGSPDTEENERLVEDEVKNDSDSQEAALENIIDVPTSAEKPLSENDAHLTKFSSTSPSNSRDYACMDVQNERLEVCIKTDSSHVAVDAVSTDEPASFQQFEKPNSTLKTPTKHVDQGQNLQSDKLARVWDSMNKLMSLCTPMKDLRTHSRTPINSFRCENVGNDCQKIVFDFPTSLLDVSIGMLESMTAMISPVESARGVPHRDEKNIASDLISVAQTPKVIHIKSDQSSYLSRQNVSDINKRLSEENENLKRELEDYKIRYSVLQGEYESVLKTAHALRTNETILKKALQEYEDETRKACNKYYILKEYADTLIISLNRSLDRCEEELKIKTEELQKLKGSF